MWPKVTVDAVLYKKSSPVMSQTSIINKAMGWRQGEERGNLAHKTCYCLDLDLKTSEGVWRSRGTDHISGVASREDQQQNEASFNCHGSWWEAFHWVILLVFVVYWIKPARWKETRLVTQKTNPKITICPGAGTFPFRGMASGTPY